MAKRTLAEVDAANFARMDRADPERAEVRVLELALQGLGPDRQPLAEELSVEAREAAEARVATWRAGRVAKKAAALAALNPSSSERQENPHERDPAAPK